LLRISPTERQRLLALTVVSGGLCGLAAVGFHLGIGKAEHLLINRAMTAPAHSWIYWTILTPALGGLLAGLALHYWVPGAVGSGIPQVKAAYALQAGRVSMRDAIGKFILYSPPLLDQWPNGFLDAFFRGHAIPLSRGRERLLLADIHQCAWSLVSTDHGNY